MPLPVLTYDAASGTKRALFHNARTTAGATAAVEGNEASATAIKRRRNILSDLGNGFP